MRHQIGQQMIMGLDGTTLTAVEKKFLVENNIGGVILMGRNVESPEQVHALTTELQSLSKQMKDRAPLLISIDMEGGRVHRLKTPFTKWPALAKVGATNSTSVAYRFANGMGEELRAVGINLDYAPCVDIFTNPANTVIGDRALATDAETVAKLGSAMVRGYLKAGVIPCAKHFPGHGNTLIDSHYGLPVEEKSLSDLEALEFEPFQKVFRSKCDLVMAAHIKFPKIDPEWPASLSEIFLKQILREKLRFRGVVITDDLDMKALTLNYGKGAIAVRALNAGCNILLYCNEPDSPPTAIDAVEKAIADGSLAKEVVAENHRLVLEMKREHLADAAPFSKEKVQAIIGSAEHLRLAQAVASGEIPSDLLSQPT